MKPKPPGHDYGYRWKPITLSDVSHALISTGVTMCSREFKESDNYKLGHVQYRQCQRCLLEIAKLELNPDTSKARCILKSRKDNPPPNGEKEK